MSIKLRIPLFLAAVALLAVSCSDHQVSGRYVSPYAKSILTDTSSVEYRILSAYDMQQEETGTIAVIGEPEETLVLSEYLLGCDNFSNINGSAVPDGLPDFSGEVIVPILDVANAPYKGYLNAGNEDFLSEINVRNFVAAVDSSCYLSAYDEDKIVSKTRSKMVVLSSSLAAAYGFSDVDTLARAVGGGIPVFSTVHSMLSMAMSRKGEGLNLGIWTTKSILGAGVYSIVFPKVAADMGIKNASYEVLCPESEGTVLDRFLEFIDRYKAVGGEGRLSSIVVDDPSVDVDSLRMAVESVMNMEHDSFLLYKSVLADDFMVIDPCSSVAASCLSYLRKSNRFTHRIAYPDVNAYVTAPCRGLGDDAYRGDGSFADQYKFGRESNSGVVTFAVVELKDKYMPSELRDMMIVKTPKIFSLYVR